MKKFSDLTLCDSRGKQRNIHIRVSGDDNGLHFSGDEGGSDVDDFWGDDDYEYWYDLDAGNAEKLLKLIGGEDDPENALKREFSGKSGLMKMTALCDQNNIKYSFNSYV